MTINVNGIDHTVNATPDTPLLWVIRDHIELTGTKFGCGQALCGACTVQMEGQAIRSCVTPVSAVQGKKITTIEGIQSDAAKAVKKAWEEEQVVQCGYCQSGQIVAAITLLENNTNPNDDDIDTAMSDNICRCNTYVRIRSAIKSAVQDLTNQKRSG
ncbi:(2Fe-2S)-binding protein [Candidatus Parabeggiatoa sp. HSG14]|uniref:(2Fe-2S)-binding protein n=1 Tax=Candidatus Parabeggiatoa sp. HSG14 TaxID=3055593 RepID=UPI0025A70C6D|nr:(2Fe-2S)-binding protein [Thiotrichales bacterium HSG14]